MEKRDRFLVPVYGIISTLGFIARDLGISRVTLSWIVFDKSIPRNVNYFYFWKPFYLPAKQTITNEALDQKSM